MSSQNGRGHFHILFHRRKSALRKGPNNRNGCQPFVFQVIFLYLKLSHFICKLSGYAHAVTRGLLSDWPSTPERASLRILFFFSFSLMRQ